MKWRGQNLLGFALMEVRDELRRVTQNEMLCDWSTVWETMKLYELEMPRSRIDHGEQERISFLTPEQFFALLSHDYDTGFGAGKASAQKEILCMLAADGMPVGKIALLLQMKTETVREIMAAKQAHIEKCRKKLEQAVKQ